MKILILITLGEVGGAQVSVLNLAKSLSSEGHEVNVGFGDGDFLKKELSRISVPFKQFDSLKRTRNPLHNLLFILELKNYLDYNQYDVVHFNSSNALFGAIGAKLSRNNPKTIFTFRGLSLLDQNYQTFKFIKSSYHLLFKFLLTYIDEPVFVSRINFETALDNKVINQGTVIYNGLNPAELVFLPRPQARLKLSGLSLVDLENKFVIGSIGRLAYPKNYEFLIKIFPEILKIKSNACLIIIGEGPEKNRYLGLIEKYGLANRVYLVGEIEDAYKLIKAFDLFVLPSIFEGLSITLIEALFSGVPILATQVGGNPELVNCSAELYQLNNANDFLRKFENIVTKADLYTQLSDHNKLQAKLFNINKTMNGYLNLYS